MLRHHLFILSKTSARWDGTRNKFLQLVLQHCCVATLQRVITRISRYCNLSRNKFPCCKLRKNRLQKVEDHIILLFEIFCCKSQQFESTYFLLKNHVVFFTAQPSCETNCTCLVIRTTREQLTAQPCCETVQELVVRLRHVIRR